jgi:hypothetical protein
VARQKRLLAGGSWLGLSEHAVGRGGGRKESSSFLEKRTKKLLLFWCACWGKARTQQARVFASFFKKKRCLASGGSVSTTRGIMMPL